MTKNTETWLTAKLAAEHLNITNRTLRKLCKQGKLKYCKPSKKLMFRKTWLDQYVLGYGKKLTPSERREMEELS